jgi:formylglycine-generating enzyme required for sulfatase activity
MQGYGAPGTAKRLPEHSVTISTDYYVAIFETTQQQWYQIFGEWKGSWKNEQWRAARPVEYIDTTNEMPNNGAIRGNWSARDAQTSTNVTWNSFVGYLRSKTGFGRIDLPTEAQWEHACRAGTTGARYSDKPIAELARCGATDVSKTLAPYADGSTNGTAVVGSYAPNPWGLYDMYGNVLEICLDRWEATPSDMTPYCGIDPVGSVTAANNNNRVCRGGYYAASAAGNVFNSYYRRSFDYFSSWLGFRLVINLGPYGTREQ